MKVLLLAAGLGTRLRPITDSTPKCLVPIGGKPLLQIWLERLSDAGFGPFLINTHYLHEQVEEFIQASKFRDEVKLVYEEKLLGTARTLIENVEFFDGEDGMVLHADNYCLADLALFLAAHKRRPRGCEVTMMTFISDNPESCGIVQVDSRGVVTDFYEKVKNPPGNLANAAIYIISGGFLQNIRDEYASALDLSRDVIRHMKTIFSYRSDGLMVDIGKLQTYRKFANG